MYSLFFGKTYIIKFSEIVKPRVINFLTVKVHTDLLNPSEFVKQINRLELYNNWSKSGDVVSVNFLFNAVEGT